MLSISVKRGIRNAVDLNFKLTRYTDGLLTSSKENLIAKFLAKDLQLLLIRRYADYFVSNVSTHGMTHRVCGSKNPCRFLTNLTSTQENEAKKEILKHSDVKLFLEQEMKEFNAVFPVIMQDITFNDLGDGSIQDVLDWQRKAMAYNVPHGKKNRGLAVLTSYKLLARPSDLTEYNLKLACILGWCVEMVQANFLIADDVMDESFTRRGMPCWFRVDGVGLMAFNDAMLLENGVYYILKKYFQNLTCYVEILEIFHQMIRYTLFGQCLDILSTPSGSRPKFELFTDDRYSTIVKYKTAYYSFLLPVKLALCLAGWKDKKCHDEAEKILLKMGHFFQVQDDFLDCYGDVTVTGKHGTDIEDGKCSWLIVSALKRASSTQRDILVNNYGCHDDLCVKKVKDVYDELELKNIYEEFEDSMFQELVSLIDNITISSKLPAKMFHTFMMVIHKRKR